MPIMLIINHFIIKVIRFYFQITYSGTGDHRSKNITGAGW